MASTTASDDVSTKSWGNDASSHPILSRSSRSPHPYTPGSGITYITCNGRVWRILGDYWYEYENPEELPGTEIPDFSKHDTHPWLHANLVFERCLGHNGKWRRGQLLAIIPNIRLVSEATERQMPRFLYRVSHSDSGGSSDSDHFRAQSVVGGLGRADISTYSQDTIRQSLALHLKNARSSGRQSFHSPWISFTSSFLFCKFWAFKNKAEGKGNVRIHIIDTNDIKCPALIVHAYTMAKAYRYGAQITPKDTMLPQAIYCQRLSSSYSEYLVWNEIFVDSDSMSLNDILVAEWGPNGKPAVHPPLEDLFREGHVHKDREQVFRLAPPRSIRRKLYGHDTRVNWSRNNVRWDRFYGPRFTFRNRVKDDERMPLDPRVFETFLRIARCVKAKFQLKVLVGMLAIRTRYIYQDEMVEEIVRRCGCGELPYEPVYYGTGLPTPRLVEVYYQQHMMLQCARKLKFDILLGDDRPKRNLETLDCEGPSGRAITHLALDPSVGYSEEESNDKSDGNDQEP